MIQNDLPSIEDIVLKPEEILKSVNELVEKFNMNYLEATTHFCEKNNYDPLAISKIIPSSLRSKIESSARELRLLKKEYNGRSLPL